MGRKVARDLESKKRRKSKREYRLVTAILRGIIEVF